MKKGLSLAILALLMLSLVAVACIRPREVAPPEDPDPAPPVAPGPPAQEWSRTFGGPEMDISNSVKQTANGGFIIAGSTWSSGTGLDFRLVKTDSQGNEEWGRTFGGPDLERANSVQQTPDGGFIIAGGTTSFGAGRTDFWLVRTDSHGNKQWSRTFGGSDPDEALSVQQTACGGFIIAGYTESFGAGSGDFWLVKTDAQGNKEWSQTLGGADWEGACSVQQTVCGGFIVGGTTGIQWRSYIWLVKTDGQGNKEWSRTFGGRPFDVAKSVQQTACGGFIIAGFTTSPAGAGEIDFWLLKTDPQGKKEWSRTFGGPCLDVASSVQQTVCAGFIIAGTTSSFGQGRDDFWLVKTDPLGNKEWSQTFGGRTTDRAMSVQQTACGGFIIAGDTSSFGAGESDFWLVKLAPEE